MTPDPQSLAAPFQPSDELRLRFYAYFKQATEGPNHTAKPAFYDIVGRYKWQAWTSLGNMSRDEAMRSYVNELKQVADRRHLVMTDLLLDPQIIETMSLTQPVADFYDVLGPFYEFVFPDKSGAKVNGNAITPSSGPKTHAVTGEKVTACDIESHTRASTATRVNGCVNGDAIETESDGEEFSDTYDHMTEENSVGVNGRRVSSDEIISARGEAELTPPRFSSASGSRSGSSRQPLRSIRNASAGGSDHSL